MLAGTQWHEDNDDSAFAEAAIEFDERAHEDDQAISEDTIEGIVAYLLTGLSLSQLFKNVFTKKVLFALLVKKDRALLDRFIEELQSHLKRCLLRLQDLDEGSDEAARLTALIGCILSYLPLGEPENNFILTIPAQYRGRWIAADYRVQRINLTPEALSDPYIAYGLVPDNHALDSKCVFMFLNRFRTCTGARMSQLFTWMPGFSVGHGLFKSGQRQLKQFFVEQNRQGGPVNCYGLSLGAAVAATCHLYYPGLCNGVIFHPALFSHHNDNLYARRLQKYPIAEGAMPHALKVYRQKGDGVWNVGVWIQPHAQIYLIEPDPTLEEIPKKSDAHVQSWLGLDDVHMRQVSYEGLHVRRVIRTTGHQALSVAALPVNVSALVVKAPGRFTWQWLQKKRQIEPPLSSDELASSASSEDSENDFSRSLALQDEQSPKRRRSTGLLL